MGGLSFEVLILELIWNRWLSSASCSLMRGGWTDRVLSLGRRLVGLGHWVSVMEKVMIWRDEVKVRDE